MEELVKTNKYQTPITKEFLDSYPEEVREQFMEFVSTVPFIQNLISPDRPRIQDLPRDEQGRAIVDITNPPTFEDADYFRQAALFFLENGCYTFLRPNSNPNSEYRKFWDKEVKKCWDGVTRESDGMYVSGYLYWFLNYCPMMVNFYKEGSKKAIRKESFGFFFEGIWWRSLYIYQAREEGHHCVELAKRGAHPYDTKVFTPDGWKLWGDIKIGDALYGTHGNTTKVIDIPYDKECDIYELTLRDGRKIQASDEHLWEVEYRHKKGIQIMSTLELIEHYKKRREITPKTPKGVEHICSIPKNEGVDLPYHETKVDPYTFGLLLGDGCFRHTSCYITQDPEDIEIEKPHIPYDIISWKDKYAFRVAIPNWGNILKEYNLKGKKSEDKFIPDEYKYNSREVRLNVLKGLMDSDGTLDKYGRYMISLSSKQLIKDITFICRSLGYNCSYTVKKTGYKINGVVKKCLPSYSLTIYTRDIIANLPRKQKHSKVLTTQYTISRELRTRIVDIKYIGRKQAKCVTVDAEDECYLIGNFITTHNCSKSYFLSAIMTHNLILGENSETKKRNITTLVAHVKEYLQDSKDGTLSKFVPTLSFLAKNTPFPRLMIKNSSNNMAWQMGYKDEYGREQGSLNQVLAVSAKDNSDILRGKRSTTLFEEFGNFPSLLELYDATRKNVEDGDYVFAQMILVGTANNKESNFQSAKTLLYGTSSYNIKSLKNVYDIKGKGRSTFGFFFPAYVNRAGCYNHDGISDVVKALMQVLMARYKAKYGADPASVLRVIAEDPITPAEAIIKVKNAFFPVTSLTERAQQLDSDPHAYDDIYIGDLVIKETGEVVFKTTDEQPIRKFPVDNDTPGALEIYNMPEKAPNGLIPNSRYIIGVDPVDNDQAESSSLYSCFVFDLFTDNIVAEYTGRRPFANDNYELTRKLSIFYNAKILYESNLKGIFSYFQTMQCTHLLADTPQYLRDKQLVKYSAFGSNQKGVRASAAINNYANGLIKDWLNKPINIITKDAEGKEVEMSVPTLYTLRGRALLEELIQFSPEINVDRVRALGMVMLYREEKLILYQGNVKGNMNEDASTLADDPFFSDNYPWK